MFTFSWDLNKKKLLFDNVYEQEYIIVNTLYTGMSFKNNVKIHVNTCGAEITKIEGASSGLKIEGASSGLNIFWYMYVCNCTCTYSMVK